MKYKKAMLNETLSLEVKMKLTNKILIAAFVLSLAATTLLAIKLTSVVKYTPQPLSKEFIEFGNRFGALKQLEINGGYEITIKKSDVDSLKIWGPDLLIRNYTVIEERNGRLKIESKVNLGNYPFGMHLMLFTKNIQSLIIKKGALLQMTNMESDSIKIIAQDSSIVKLSNCNYRYANLTTSDRSIISMEKTNEANVSLKNESMIVVDVGDTGLIGRKDKLATLIVNGKKLNEFVFTMNSQTLRGL